MADEATATAPIATATTAPESSAGATNGVSDTHTAAETSEATVLASGDAKISSESEAGAQAIVAVNPPDGGDSKPEVETVPAGDDEAQAGGKKEKRKSSGGVPEHKSKKLNRKKSVAQLNLNLQPGDHCWARLKGFPAWPSVVCDEEMLPEILLSNRPVSTKRPDGTYRDDFLEEGKNVKDRTYPVMFLHTNEFAWMPNTALPRLEPSECEIKNEGKKMSKGLKEAYELAQQQHDLGYFKQILKEHDEEMMRVQQEQAKREEELAEQEAAKSEKAEAKKDKSRRKSKAADGDEMDIDDEALAEAKPSKKRKKDAESEGEGPKPKKTPKTKITVKAPDPSAKKAEKPKKVVKPPKAKAEEKDEESAEPELTEKAKLERREKAVLYLRHRLQKGFLNKDKGVPPKEEDMPSMAEFFTQLESYSDLEPAINRTTKIHKVLKQIVKLPTIPREEEFNFKKRSHDLLNAWNFGTDEASAPATDGATTNCESKAEEPAKSEDTESKAAITEPPAAPVEATNPGNDAVDEADTTMPDASVVDAAAKTNSIAEASSDAAPATTEAAPASETAAA